MTERIAVIGLGYVGLPVALAFARKYPGTIGFDISSSRIEALRRGEDSTMECTAEELSTIPIQFTSDPEDLNGVTFFVVAVPTPVDDAKRPDLGMVCGASEIVGKRLSKGAVVVYESTVYPGVTEEVCGPILAKASGLTQGVDFKLGYSPERINPGDKAHSLESIVKVVSGEDEESLERVAAAYSSIVEAGVHRAPTIKVAEAAKVIENTQRDLNIALMNELAKIFDLMGIATRDVLAAANTKWNFLDFRPGLVGGHCIGVDPFYLTTKAQALGYHPEVILAGRRINDDMGRYVAERTIKNLAKSRIPILKAKVAVLGVTFKENVPDIRNSRVPDIVAELMEYGIKPLLHDPLADAAETAHEYGVSLVPWKSLTDLDAVILAVPHRDYLSMEPSKFYSILKPSAVLFDVKSAIDRSGLREGIVYSTL